MPRRNNAQKCKCEEWNKNIDLINLSHELLNNTLEKRYEKFKYCPYCGNKLTMRKYSWKICSDCKKKIRQSRKTPGGDILCFECHRKTITIIP